VSSFPRFLVLVLALLLPSVARAADSEAQARTHFDQGQKLTAQGRYTDAISEFTSGWELSHKPLFLFNIAECARLAGERERARMNYQLYLEKDPQGKLAGKAKERLTELEQKAVQAPTPVAAPAPAAAPSAPPAPPATATTPAAITSPATDGLTAAAAPPPQRKPIWKRTGFWVGIGVGAAVLVAGATTAGVLATRGSGGCSGTCLDLR